MRPPRAGTGIIAPRAYPQRQPAATPLGMASRVVRSLLLLCGTAVAAIGATAPPPARAQTLADLEVHGFISQSYQRTTGNSYLLADTEKGSYRFTEAGLSFGAQPTDRVRLGLQVFARHLGAQGNFDLVLDWAVVEYTVADWLKLRAGRLKLPYGLYNESRDIDAARISVMLPEGVYDEVYRGILSAASGFGVTGHVPLGPAGDLAYDAVVGILRPPDDSLIRSHTRSLVGGRALWETPVRGLRAGASILVLDATFEIATVDASVVQMLVAQGIIDEDSRGIPLDAPRLKLWVASVEWQRSGFTAAAEYGRWQGEADPPQQIAALVPEIYTDVNIERFHVSLSARPRAWLQVGVHGSAAFLFANDRSGKHWVGSARHTAWHKDVAASLRSDLTDNLLVKLELRRIDGSLTVMQTGTQEISTIDPERHWWHFSARVTGAF